MMIIGSKMFKKITIIGVGLMGGSLGMAIKEKKLAKEVVGVSHKQSTLMEAIKLKAIDTGETDVKKGIKNADLVILATPVELIIRLLGSIGPHLKRGCIVTDMGSAKTEILEAAEKKLVNPSFFVGGHPLVGSEKKGVANADVNLYTDAQCILTPTKATNRGAKEKVKNFWVKLGAKVKNMSAEEHDQALSYTSHLPHLLAFSLMEAIPEQYLEYTSNGFKDTTRIASSSPQMWNDICLSNSKHLIGSLDELVLQLAELRKVIVTNDSKKLTEHFVNAKKRRDGLK